MSSDQPVQCHVHPGELPEFWDRSAIFFANLLSLFFGNTGEVQKLVDEISGVSTYGGRLLPIINLLFQGSDNLLVLEAHPNRALMDYQANNLNLSLPAFEIFPYKGLMGLEEGAPSKQTAGLLDLIGKHPAEWIDGFVTDASLVEVARVAGKKTITSLEGSKTGNNKLLLHQFLEKASYPVFDTEIASNHKEIGRALEALGTKGYDRAVVKSQIGASGIGIYKISIQNGDLKEIPEYVFFEGPCLVQGWLDENVRGVNDVFSPSVQMFLDDGSVRLYDLTEQILSEDSIHEGNVAPPPRLWEQEALKEELLKQAEAVGLWLHEQGYRGTSSVDFHVTMRTEASPEVRVCEVNARVTGATYPSVLARRFVPHGAWLMRNLKMDKAIDAEELLAMMDQCDALFQPGKRRGILPINFNLDEQDNVTKGQFLLLGESPTDCMMVLEDTETKLPVDWLYDRD